MSGAPRTRTLLLAGLVLSLVIGEAALRFAGDALPLQTGWPTPESEVKYSQLVEEGRDPDVVFLGSSFVEAAIDPEQIESVPESYNLAMPFSSFETMEWWLRDVVFAVASPEMVVVGASVWSDPDVSATNLAEALTQASHRTVKGRRTGGLYLFASRGVLGQMDRLLARERLIQGHAWTEFGHQQGYYGMDVSESWGRRRPVATGKDLSALTRLIELASDHSASVVILVEPMAASIAPPTTDSEKYVARLRALASDAGALVLEPPRHFYEDSLYVDGVHFNASAAEQFSQFTDENLSAFVARVAGG